MHKWRYALTAIISIFVLNASAANWVCGRDLDQNGSLTEKGETAKCDIVDGSPVCPLAAKCSLDSSEQCSVELKEISVNILRENSRDLLDISFDLKNGTWAYNAGPGIKNVRPYKSIIEIPTIEMSEVCGDESGITFASAGIWKTGFLYNDGIIYFARGDETYEVVQHPSCGNSLTGRVRIKEKVEAVSLNENSWHSGRFIFNAETKNCENSDKYKCPLGDNYSCSLSGEQYMCGQNTCINTEETSPKIKDNITGEMLVDDGRRDTDGLCMDQLMIYSGRAGECLTEGVTTAFQNCCESKSGKILTDDMGSLVSLATSTKTIQTVYQIAKGAYYAYKSSIAVGATVAEASATAATVTYKSVLIAVDPTTLAISVAMYFIMEYLTKSCDEESMDTAIMSGSGYCHYIGDYCKEEWPVGGCVQESSTYCCFNSKMARIMHEQGRPQLKSFGENSWGTIEEPNCRGFTPEEFQSLDFSKIDLSEYYEDLARNTESVIHQKINEGVNDFHEKTR